MPYGYESLDILPTIPLALQDIATIYARAITNQGGSRAKPVGFQRRGSASYSPDLDVLKEAGELEDTLRKLLIELLRVRRRYWEELIGPLPENGSDYDARARQVQRVREAYPAHWSNNEVAIVEQLTPRYVRELRGGDRHR